MNTPADKARALHDRLGSMIDQVGQPDYSLLEMCEGLREVRDELLTLSSDERHEATISTGGDSTRRDAEITNTASRQAKGSARPQSEDVGSNPTAAHLPAPRPEGARSDTPRTDEQAFGTNLDGNCGRMLVVPAELARQLERELAEERSRYSDALIRLSRCESAPSANREPVAKIIGHNEIGPRVEWYGAYPAKGALLYAAPSSVARSEGWVSVGERKPEPRDVVLLWSGDVMSTGFWTKEDGWFVDALHESDPFVHPTHWRALPEGPSLG